MNNFNSNLKTNDEYYTDERVVRSLIPHLKLKKPFALLIGIQIETIKSWKEIWINNFGKKWQELSFLTKPWFDGLEVKKGFKKAGSYFDVKFYSNGLLNKDTEITDWRKVENERKDDN